MKEKQELGFENVSFGWNREEEEEEEEESIPVCLHLEWSSGGRVTVEIVLLIF